MTILAILISGLILLVFVRIYLAFPSRYFRIFTTTFPKYEYDDVSTAPELHEPLVLERGHEGLIVVTDPVGHPRTGESACILAQDTIKEFYQKHNVGILPKEFLKQACFRAHRRISEQINHTSGGCSIAILFIDRNQLYWASSGNVGIYLCVKELEQLNQMDLYKYKLNESVLQRKIRTGEVLTNSLKNELTAYLGHENLRKIELCDDVLPLERTDKLLVASKKVYETLSPLELENIVKKGVRGSEKMKMLQIAFWNHAKADIKARESVRGQTSAVFISRFKKHKL